MLIAPCAPVPLSALKVPRWVSEAIDVGAANAADEPAIATAAKTVAARARRMGLECVMVFAPPQPKRLTNFKRHCSAPRNRYAVSPATDARHGIEPSLGPSRDCKQRHCPRQ